MQRLFITCICLEVFFTSFNLPQLYFNCSKRLKTNGHVIAIILFLRLPIRSLLKSSPYFFKYIKVFTLSNTFASVSMRCPLIFREVSLRHNTVEVLCLVSKSPGNLIAHKVRLYAPPSQETHLASNCFS